MRDERNPVSLGYLEKAVEQIPGAGWLLAPVAKRTAQKMFGEWRRNQSVALKAAERSAGYSREELEDQINTVPGAVPLAIRILWTAGTNGHDAVLKGMGRTLGHALREPNRIKEAELVIAAMSEFGPSHRAVLEALEAKPEDENWGSEDVPNHVDLPDTLAGLSLSSLNAYGLVQTISGYAKLVYEITDLGREVLKVLRDVDDEPEDEDGSV